MSVSHANCDYANILYVLLSLTDNIIHVVIGVSVGVITSLSMVAVLVVLICWSVTRRRGINDQSKYSCYMYVHVNS